MRGLRSWLAPLAIYLATRCLAALFVVLAAPGRVVPTTTVPGNYPSGTAPSPPSYWDVMASWDGQYYWEIAARGYPSTTLGPAGDPVQTSLAFFPLYPLLVRGVMTVTGLPFQVAAPTVSLLLGGAAVLVVYRLVADRLGRRSGLIAVALLCCFVSAPILQAAYTESLALLLVATALLLLARRRYLWAIPVVLLLGLTRNISIVLAPVVALHWWCRLRDREEPGPSGVERVGLIALTASTVVAMAQWPLLAALITGEPAAYVDTVGAWDGYTGSVLRPPLVWAVIDSGPLAVALLAAGVLLGISLLARPDSRRWGPELWGWAVAYPLYVLLAAGATPSWMRYLLLAFPLGLLAAPPVRTPRQRRAQVAVVLAVCLAGLVAQAVWVDKYLAYAGPDGGWGYP